MRQSLRRETANTALFGGVERYFETLFALAQNGRVHGRGWIVDPLQCALTLTELLLPFTYLPWARRGAQRAVLGRMADGGRRLGYTAYLEPERAVRAEDAPAVPSIA